MSLNDRIRAAHTPDPDSPPCEDCGGGLAHFPECPSARREPFMAPWRRRQIEQAGGRFVAVAWREVPAA